MSGEIELVFLFLPEPEPRKPLAGGCIWCEGAPSRLVTLTFTPLGDACQRHAPGATALAAGTPPDHDRLGLRRRYNWLL